MLTDPCRSSKTTFKEAQSNLGMMWGWRSSEEFGQMAHGAARSVVTRRAGSGVQPCLTLQEEAEISCWIPQTGACP